MYCVFVITGSSGMTEMAYVIYREYVSTFLHFNHHFVVTGWKHVPSRLSAYNVCTYIFTA